MAFANEATRLAPNDIVCAMNLQFDGVADGLTPIESQRGQDALLLDFPFGSEIVPTTIGESLDAQTIDTLTLQKHLLFIKKLLLKLVDMTSQQNHTPQLTA